MTGRNILVLDEGTTSTRAMLYTPDGVRVVLFCDIVRPLRWPLSWLNRLIITSVARSPFIKRARAQHVAREQAFAAQWAEHAEVGRP